MRSAPGVLLVALLGGLFPLQAAIDRTRGPRPDVVTTLLPDRILPVLAMGHRGALADLLEIEATNFLIRRLQATNRMEKDHIARLYSGVLALAPEDPDAFWRASVFHFSVADRPDAAFATLEEGMRRVPSTHPRKWYLYYEAAVQRLLAATSRPEAERLASTREAAALLREGALLPRAPFELEQTAARLASRGLSAEEALEQEAAVWQERSTRGEPALRARARQRALEARSALVRERLQRKVVDAIVRLRGRPPGDLYNAARVMGVDPTDPLGVGYALQGTTVLAPGVDAARLERVLRPLHDRFRAQHPGQTPTLEELGLSAEQVPAWLVVTPGPDGVTVRPR